MLTSIQKADLDHEADRAKAYVAHHRAKVTNYLAEASTEVHIARLVNDLVIELAKAEGRYQAFVVAAAAQRSDRDPYLAVAREVQRGADDSWSGRSNDVRRAHFDGLCEVMSDLQDFRA